MAASRTFVIDRLTDGQTDGARLLRTRASPKNRMKQIGKKW